MGDKPSKSQSDDEIVPPHLARTDFRFDQSARPSVCDFASSDIEYNSRYRPYTESDGATVSYSNSENSESLLVHQPSTIDSLSSGSNSSHLKLLQMASSKHQVDSRKASSFPNTRSESSALTNARIDAPGINSISMSAESVDDFTPAATISSARSDTEMFQEEIPWQEMITNTHTFPLVVTGNIEWIIDIFRSNMNI